MGKCKNCEYWKRGEAHVRWFCKCGYLDNPASWPPNEDGITVVSIGKADKGFIKSDVQTGPEFGCIHFKESKQ